MTAIAPKYVIDAAEEYIAASRSDPFTRARVYTHIKNGVASPRSNRGTEDRIYSAERTVEHRSYETEEGTVRYTVPAWINIKRP